jgi:double-strand break repair protein MRE11
LRDAEMKCVQILRDHVLGDHPVSIDFVSDPRVNFSHCARKEVNYRDPNMNIGMPVFSIHGNHDDPSGLGGHSCLDTLHSTGLLNYFGRINNLDQVDVSPLLITKGEAKLALYGMSSIKDERLHRLFRNKKVSPFKEGSFQGASIFRCCRWHLVD